MIHCQIDVTEAVEEMMERYTSLTFNHLEELVIDNPRVHRLAMDWGRDRVHEMICFAFGFKRDERTQRYIPGSHDSHTYPVFRFLHFHDWRYEEGKLYYTPPVS